MIRELPIPPDASQADQAIEVFRGWVIDGPLQCSLFPTIWKDSPGTWGVLLADAAHHIANAIGEATGAVPETILSEIKRVLISELKSPSDEHEGVFMERPTVAEQASSSNGGKRPS
jgi:Domain of unknown function (DUF5076)